ncbi:unnamed protein product [Hapterophycus canaliculatus]
MVGNVFCGASNMFLARHTFCQKHNWRGQGDVEPLISFGEDIFWRRCARDVVPTDCTPLMLTRHPNGRSWLTPRVFYVKITARRAAVLERKSTLHSLDAL